MFLRKPFNLHLDPENQGLEKSRSTSNLRKSSGPANLDFFSRSPPRKKARLITAHW